MDAMDGELEEANEFSSDDWRTEINKENFTSLHQIEKMSEPWRFPGSSPKHKQ